VKKPNIKKKEKKNFNQETHIHHFQKEHIVTVM